MGTFQHLFLAKTGDQRLGAGDDQKIRVFAGCDGRLDLALKLLDAKQFLLARSYSAIAWVTLMALP
ncbi:hypothetical protein [Mesorhizobium sp.]|uniref:hypothetical protein n=1 Tax=Mesorhizobium sp. TaxID=1871066 RepID=UPI0025CBC5B9|nr:hypothetical protein [Mesorhizobium sp.]